MLAPGDGSDHVQVIDARDVARFVNTAIERDLHGIFNLAGPRLTWRDFLQVLAAKELVWVSADIIRSAGTSEFELPLFRPERGQRSGLMDVSYERALSAGLKLTDPVDTAAVTREWLRGRESKSALSPEREAELIHLSRARDRGRVV